MAKPVTAPPKALAGRVPFYRHDLGEPELAMLREVLAQPILTTGAYTERVERRLAELLGARHALCLSSCTGALHLSLLALGIGPGDEVITTPLTFVATATAILEAGARPVFADVEPGSGNLDPGAVAAAITPRTKAIMPVHLYGLMCDMRALRRIADRHDLALIEDAAHCLEGLRDGIRPGQLAATACFSFYATKNLTCGEGGALVTDDTALYERLRLLRLHGVTKTADERHREGYTHWDMALLGWKYNMSNIEAAILLPQFERLAGKLAQRDELARRYVDLLAGLPGVRVPDQLAGERCVHAHHIFPVLIERLPRDAVLAGLLQRDIEVVINYRPVHLLQYFRQTFGHRPGEFPVAEQLGNALISLPFYPGMQLEHVDLVVARLAETLHAVASAMPARS